MSGMMPGIDFGALLPELLLAVAAVGGLLLGSWLPRRRQWIVRALAVAALAGGLVVTLARISGPEGSTGDGSFTIDLAIQGARLAVLVGAAAVILFAGDSMGGHPRETEFTVLLLLGALGALLLAGASDVLLLAVGYLLASVPLYPLVGLDRRAGSTEAMLKYYLLGALFGVCLLLGIVLLIAAGGGAGYDDLAMGAADAPPGLVVVGAVAVAAGLLFKAGAVPAHFWVPDAIEGATPAAAAFVATVPKLGALVALLRLGEEALGPASTEWTLFLAVVAALTMTLGNLAAFFQSSVRRLLGYSTISQVGYLLMIVAAGGGTALAQPSLLLYLLAYALTNVGAFAVVSAVPRLQNLDDYRGFARSHPWLAVALVVCLLGLVGTPPTAIFVGKVTGFTAAVDGGLAWLAVLAVLNTVASLFYYLRWIAPLFRAAPHGEPSVSVSPRTAGSAAAVTLAAASVLLGIASGPVLAAFGLG